MPLKKALFYPYAFAEEELNIEILDAIVDSNSFSDRINLQTLALNLQDISDWKTASLKVRITLPDNAAERLLPVKERSSPPWRALVSLSCERTRWRRGYPLSMEGDKATWEGSLEIERQLLRDTVKIRAYLVRTASGSVIDPEFADRKGTRLASSPQWELQIDHTRLPPGNYLDVRWENFNTSDHPVRVRTPTLLYYLDFTDAIPVLWLNEGIDDLKPVLMSLGTVGSRAAVRNILFDSIAQSVWVGLVMHAATAAGDDESEPPEEWQRGILLQFAPLVYSDCSRELAVEQLISAAKDREQIPTLIELILVAVQSKLNLAKSTGGILNILG